MQCWPKLDQATRWSGGYEMLLSGREGYEKEAFDKAGIEYPVSVEKLDVYINILRPAYETSLLFQHTKATIAIVVPQVLLLLAIWKTLEELTFDQSVQDLCKLLIYKTKLKFKRELQSPIYHVNTYKSLKSI